MADEQLLDDESRLIKIVDSIETFGNWSWSVEGDDMNKMIFYSKETGQKVPQPSNFPSREEIEQRRIEMQEKWDSGNYESLSHLKVEYPDSCVWPDLPEYDYKKNQQLPS